VAADLALHQRILACVESIPPGRVMTYGDIAEFVGSRAPRLVGRVLAMDGGTVPWHRVVRADGTPAEHLYSEQRQRLLAEGVRFLGDRVDLAEYRWDGRPVRASRRVVRNPPSGAK
jgi:methylated-DNA-protein-cysteine methyltransferase-like protein